MDESGSEGEKREALEAQARHLKGIAQHLVYELNPVDGFMRPYFSDQNRVAVR